MDINTYTANLSSFVRDVRDYYSRCGHEGSDTAQFTLPLAMVSYALRNLSSDDKATLFNALYERGFINRIDDKQVTFSERFVA